MKLAFTNPDYLNVFVDANQEAIKAKHIVGREGLSAGKAQTSAFACHCAS